MLLIVAVCDLPPTGADAACNVIPPAIQPFRAIIGSVDRPFAGPGDWVELSADPCEQRAGITDPVEQLVVSVLFTPPHGGPATAVILTADSCEDPAIVRQISSCNDVGRVVCRRLRTSPPLADIEHPANRPNNLRFRFPDTDDVFGPPDDDGVLTGPATMAVTRRGAPLPCNVASTGCVPRPGLLACVDQLLASGTCASVPHTQFGHFTALPPPTNYAALCTAPAFPNGPCTGAANGTARMTVDGDGNILVPLDWSGILVRHDAVPVPRLLQTTSAVDAFDGLVGPIKIPGPAFLESFSPEGRKLPPLFEERANLDSATALKLFGSADAAYTVLRIDRRAVRGRCEAADGAPGRGCAADFECPAGQACRRFLACAGGPFDGLPCTGDADACSTGGSAACQPTTCTRCAGGARAGLPCRGPADCADTPTIGPVIDCAPGSDPCFSDLDCPGSECGAGLFDFSTRLAEQQGPVTVTDVDAVALDPVPLAGFISNPAADKADILVQEEAITRANLPSVADPAQADLNGDGDTTDPVLTLTARDTGASIPIGAMVGDAQTRGRAIARIHQGPFRFPAVATDADIVAFLEPEPLQGNQDTNGNGQILESTLRVFDTNGIELVTDTAPVTADAAPVIDGQSLAVSNGLVFFRTAASDVLPRRTELLTPGADGNGAAFGGSDGSRPAVSADGRFVAFASTAPFVVDDRNARDDVFVVDRLTGTIERVSVRSDGSETDAGGSRSPAISADGRVVAFLSDAPDLVPGDTNGSTDVFVHDRVTQETERISVTTEGAEAHPEFVDPAIAISADGNVVAFTSDAPDLVSNDMNGRIDVFAHERQSGITERVSTVRVFGFDFDVFGDSLSPAISADGRWVAFASDASELGFSLDGGFDDTNGATDVFVHDRLTARNERVSVSSTGMETHPETCSPRGVALSADGRFVAFQSDAPDLVGDDGNGAPDVFVHDRMDGSTVRVSVTSSGTETHPTSCDSDGVALSGDGRLVAFASDAPDLVIGDTNGTGDVFVRDRDTARTDRISVSSSGSEGHGVSGLPALSADGSVGVFESDASDLVSGDANFEPDVFARDFARATTARVDMRPASLPFANSSDVSISADGTVVAFLSDASNLVPGDTNGYPDVFVYDRTRATTERVSVTSDETEAPFGAIYPAVSGDGRFVAFDSYFSGDPISYRLYVRDRLTGTTEEVGTGVRPALSADGRFVVFEQAAAGPFHLYVRDRLTGTTERVDVASDGRESIGGTYGALYPGGISADGRFVAFASDASDLIDGDTNADFDVFVHDRSTGRTERVSVAPGGAEIPGGSFWPAISADGQVVGFVSFSINSSPGFNVYVHDRLTAETERVNVSSEGSARPFAPPIAFVVLSADGRFVAFESFQDDLVPGDSSGDNLFVHDRVTGATARVNLSTDGGEPHGGRISSAALSADGRTIVFPSDANDLVPGDTNLGTDIFVRSPEWSASPMDATFGGRVDPVLRVLRPGPDARPVTLGPAMTAAVDSGNVAFLSPSISASPATTGEVMLSLAGRPALDLGRRAIAVALSPDVLAAVVVTTGQSNGVGRVATHPVGDGAWTNLDATADAVAVSGALVVFLTPDPGATAGSPVRHRLQIYDAAAGRFLIGGDARVPAPVATDFVIGGTRGRELIAFRTNEGAAGSDLNEDHDEADDVLQIYDRERGILIDTDQPITPCRLEACDPRLPYRVGSDTVTFLTLECDQGGPRIDAGCPQGGTDLNGDATADDLVVQTFNVRSYAPGARNGHRAVLGSAKTGVCTTTGVACVRSRDCGGTGICFVPPGGCIEDLGIACDPRQSTSGCSSTQFCFPDVGFPGQGRCFEQLAPTCTKDEDCRDPSATGTAPTATCNAGAQAFQRLVNPLTRVGSRKGAGSKVFTGAGRCVEDLGVACDVLAGAGRDGCRHGAFCERLGADPHTGRCMREQRVCVTADDCPQGVPCRQQLLTLTANDADGDEIPDSADDCPTVANPTQEDANGNGVGDACDPSTCPMDGTLTDARCRATAVVDATVRLLRAGQLRETLRRIGELARKNLDAGGQSGRRGRVALQRTDRALRSFQHRVRSLAGRQQIEATTRATLITMADTLRRDLRRLSLR